jgi:hypothetical protein
VVTEHIKIIDGIVSIKPVLDWAYQLICKGLQGGPVEIVIRRYQEKRSLPQNSKQWAMYADIAKQLTWHGMPMDPEDWKDLLCHEWKPQQIIPAISGGFCVLNARTSKAKKPEMADLIEIVYAFGSEKGVIWSEPALKCYQEYREAQCKE